MINASSTSTDWPPDAIPQAWIEKLFDEMLLTYGKKFSDQWGGIDPRRMKIHWARKLAKLTNEEMTRGVTAMRTKDWPPTLNEFLSMCKPPIDPIHAYYEAVEGLADRDRGNIGKWSHRAIFWTASRLAFELKGQSFSAVKPRWEKALSDEMAKGSWPEIKKPSPSLVAPGKVRSSKEDANRMLKQFRESGILKVDGDHRRWIPKALQRAAAGDKSVPEITVRLAKEAMQENLTISPICARTCASRDSTD